MDRRLFLRNAALIAAGVVAADQLDLLDRLLWEPKRLWTGWSPSPPANTVALLADLYRKENTNLREALKLMTPEHVWARMGKENIAWQSREIIIPLVEL